MDFTIHGRHLPEDSGEDSMPRRRVHVAAGGAIGIAIGVATSRKLPRGHQDTHMAFAGIGGVLGSVAPDVLEPATSPNHRAFFHSVAACVALSAARAADWASKCHRAAAECGSRASAATDEAVRRWENIKAFLWRALAGFLIGLVAGYASHLALDATTSRSLPLFSSAI